MPYQPTVTAMKEQRSLAEAATMDGVTRWPGLSYEEGVENTIAWIVGDTDTPPMDD